MFAMKFKGENPQFAHKRKIYTGTRYENNTPPLIRRRAPLLLLF